MMLNNRYLSILFWLFISVLVVTCLGLMEYISAKKIRAQGDHPPTVAAALYSVKFVSPVYLSTGLIVEGEVQVFSEDMKIELSKLACAEGGIADRLTCRYGTCAFALSPDVADRLNGEEHHPMTFVDYDAAEQFMLANFRQVWYAGILNPHDNLFVMWYRVTAEVEDLIAETVLVVQKIVCDDSPVLGLASPVFTSPLFQATTPFALGMSSIPVCGKETWRSTTHTCRASLSKEQLQADWAPLCRWRPNDTAQWRLFSTRPEHNIFHVSTNKRNKKGIYTYNENKTLTLLLPQENLNYWGAVPSDIRKL